MHQEAKIIEKLSVVKENRFWLTMLKGELSSIFLRKGQSRG